MNNINFLQKIVEQNSHSRNKEGVDQVGNMFANELNFMKIDRIPHEKLGDLLVFSCHENNSEKPHILLTGHSDTVHPPDINLPTSIEGNIMKGPGTQDMKGGLFIISETLKKLNSNNQLSNITFILIPDEEIGSEAHVDYLTSKYKEFDYGIVYEPTMQMDSVNKSYPKERSIVIERKGAGFIEVEITGPGGHSGVLVHKKNRFSAIQEAARKIIEIEELADYIKGTTLNVGTITGGIAPNVLAQKCKFAMDYRVKTVLEERRVFNSVDRLCKDPSDNKFKISHEIINSGPPMENNHYKKEFIKVVQKVANKLNLKLHLEKRGGGSDANNISEYVPAVIDGMGVQGDREHSPDEFIYLDSIQPGIDLSYGVINELLKN